MSMWTFRALHCLAGPIYIAQGVVQLLSLGFWLPAWTTRYNCWVCDIDCDF